MYCSAGMIIKAQHLDGHLDGPTFAICLIRKDAVDSAYLCVVIKYNSQYEFTKKKYKDLQIITVINWNYRRNTTNIALLQNISLGSEITTFWVTR